MASADALQPAQDLPFRVDLSWGPDGTACLSVCGELDWVSVPELRRALDQAVREGLADVDLDLSGLRFCDAAGLGVLVDVYRTLATAGRSLRLVNVGGRLRRVFAMGGVEYLLEPPG